MMIRFLFFSLFVFNNLFAQHCDTVISLSFVKLHFDTVLKQGIYFEYYYTPQDYHCKRSNTFYEAKYTLKNKDYVNTSFDRGHIFPASYVGNKCDLSKQTNIHYNIIPQYANLNRGAWAEIENKIRKSEIKNKLFIQVYCFNYAEAKNFKYAKEMVKIITDQEGNKTYYYFTNKPANNYYKTYNSLKELHKWHPSTREIIR